MLKEQAINLDSVSGVIVITPSNGMQNDKHENSFNNIIILAKRLRWYYEH